MHLIDQIYEVLGEDEKTRRVGTLVGLPVIESPTAPKDKILVISRLHGAPHRLLAVIEMGTAAFSTSELLNELWHRAQRAMRVRQ